MGFYVGLSTNGTPIDGTNIASIAEVGYDYVGISLDGIGPTHDRFRRRDGAFDASLRGIRLCLESGIKVGLRFTLTQDNFHELPAVLDLMDREGADKFYLSHLNYAGRGNKHRADDAHFGMTRAAMDLLFERAWKSAERGDGKEFVTGNNEADGVYLLMWAAERFPDRVDHLRAKLVQWGGNSSGVNVANIDNLGNVHPDTFWWHYNARQCPRPPVLGDLAGCVRPDHGRAESISAHDRGALRFLYSLRHLRRQHPGQGLAAHRQRLGRGSRMLSDRWGNRCHGQPTPRAADTLPEQEVP